MTTDTPRRRKQDQEITQPRFMLTPISVTVDRVGPMELVKQAGETERRFDMKFAPEAADALIEEIQRQRAIKTPGSGMITISFWGRQKQQ